MTSKRVTWFLTRLALVVWLATAATVLWVQFVEAASSGEPVAICHKGETKYVPPEAVPAHLGHGDYLGVCENGGPTPTPTPSPAQASPGDGGRSIGNLWLLRSSDTPGYDCLIWSDTHPSIERQGALCWPDIFDGQWVATSSWSATVWQYPDGSTSWFYDAWTPWRLR